MKIELQKGFSKALSRKIDGYTFEVGVLDDKPHYDPLGRGNQFLSQEVKQYAGGPARKQSSRKSGKSIGDVLVANMRRLNKNILLEPFQNKNSELVKFMNAFLKTALARSSKRRVENLLQAVVRVPILKQEYGMNTSETAFRKGFDRHLIDTAQMIKAIKAKVKFRGR